MDYSTSPQYFYHYPANSNRHWTGDTYSVRSDQFCAHCQRGHYKDGAANADEYRWTDDLEMCGVEECYGPQPGTATDGEHNTKHHRHLNTEDIYDTVTVQRAGCYVIE